MFRFLAFTLCLISFSSELVLDGSTSFVRVEARENIGKLVIGSVNPSENKDLPQPEAPEAPDWAKTPPLSHSANLLAPARLPFSLLVFTAPIFRTPTYQDPSIPLLHRPPIA